MAEAKKNDPAKPDPRRDPDNPSTSINAMDRAESDKAAAEQAELNKEAAERSANEPPPPPTPTQEEADAMKEGALGVPPTGTPVSKREAKAESGSSKADYKTR